MANEVIGMVFLFVIISVAAFIGVNTIGTIHSVNAGNCAYTSNHTLENCTYSNSQYDQINATTTQANYMFTTIGVMEWLIIAGVLITITTLFMKLRRK